MVQQAFKSPAFLSKHLVDKHQDHLRWVWVWVCGVWCAEFDVECGVWWSVGCSRRSVGKCVFVVECAHVLR